MEQTAEVFIREIEQGIEEKGIKPVSLRSRFNLRQPACCVKRLQGSSTRQQGHWRAL